jgi:lactoylglutathione lyase
MDPFDRRFHQAEDQVQVVDHQVEHGADRLAPGCEMADARGLDEEGPVDQLGERPTDRGEALDMADLQDPAVVPGEIDQPAGIRHRLGDRLLHQDMGAVFDEIPRDREMARGRSRDADGVDTAEEGSMVRKRLDTVLAGDRGRPGRIAVHDRHEAGAREFGILVGMMLAEMADADDGGPQLSHDLANAPCFDVALGPACWRPAGKTLYNGPLRSAIEDHAVNETAAHTATDTSAEGRQLLHTMIRVLDLDKSIDFYTRHLGMKVLRRKDYPTGQFTLAFVGYGDEADHSVIELTHNWGQKEPYAIGTGFGHLAVSVPDIYTTCESLAKEGVKIPRPPGPMKHGGSVIAFIEDPDGYKIELIERKPG